MRPGTLLGTEMRLPTPCACIFKHKTGRNWLKATCQYHGLVNSLESMTVIPGHIGGGVRHQMSLQRHCKDGVMLKPARVWKTPKLVAMTRPLSKRTASAGREAHLMASMTAASGSIRFQH